MAGLNIRDACRKWGPEYLAVCGIAKYFPHMNAESHVFFVNWGGDDDAGSLGQTPDAPLLTITKALSYCTAEKNDYIFVMHHYKATGETWPIVVNKRSVHLIGLNDGSPVNPGPVLIPETDSAESLDITVQECEIANMEFNGYSSSYNAIKISGSGMWGNWIHHCQFCSSSSGGAALHGINIAQEMIYGVIENCVFGKGIVGDGIHVPANAGPNSIKGLVIRDNHFRVATEGINILDASGDFDEGGIFNNTFIMGADTKGYGILLASGVVGGMVDGNHFGEVEAATVTAATIPVHQTTTFGPSWGVNWNSGAVVPIAWPSVA